MKRTLAGLKEALPVGTRVTLVEVYIDGRPKAHNFKGVTRTIELNRTADFALADKPAGDPLRRISWCAWPKRADLSFPAPDQFRIRDGSLELIYRIEGGPDAAPEQGR